MRKESHFIDFSKAFDSIYREKMEQILLAYSLPKETVTAIMIFYKNTKVMVCPSYEDTIITAGVLQGVLLAPYLSIVCLDSILQTSIDFIKENGFT